MFFIRCVKSDGWKEKYIIDIVKTSLYFAVLFKFKESCHLSIK